MRGRGSKEFTGGGDHGALAETAAEMQFGGAYYDGCDVGWPKCPDEGHHTRSIKSDEQ